MRGLSISIFAVLKVAHSEVWASPLTKPKGEYYLRWVDEFQHPNTTSKAPHHTGGTHGSVESMQRLDRMDVYSWSHKLESISSFTSSPEDLRVHNMGLLHFL